MKKILSFIVRFLLEFIASIFSIIITIVVLPITILYVKMQGELIDKLTPKKIFLIAKDAYNKGCGTFIEAIYKDKRK